MKQGIAIMVVFCITCVAVFFMGHSIGVDSGARQMARHILNPAFTTESFNSVVEEEKGVENHGPALTYLQVLDRIGARNVFPGPLEVNEPNTLIMNCAFVNLECVHGESGSLLLGTDAEGCSIVGNLFVSGPLISPIDPGMAVCADNKWWPKQGELK